MTAGIRMQSANPNHHAAPHHHHNHHHHNHHHNHHQHRQHHEANYGVENSVPASNSMYDASNSMDAKSMTSYKSGHSARSSVLERAREYNRRIDEQRSKSLERQSQSGASAVSAASSAYNRRSRSAGREQAEPVGNRVSTRERAMATVRRETSTPNANEGHGAQSYHRQQQQPPPQQQQQQQHSYSENVSPRNRTPSSANGYSRPKPVTPRRHQPVRSSDPTTPANARSRDIQHSQQAQQSRKKSPGGSFARGGSNVGKDPDQEQQENIVTPELLVDALSGHEDGLLAIAERLMEHYDSGYDVMGEAIIDAFADVQKLFQHVVEAAHMEGAAFEASRREQEMTELRKQAGVSADGLGLGNDPDVNPASPSAQQPNPDATSPNGPTRHDEFIDQDVKDVLTDAIRQGSSMRDANKHMECYQLYEQACQSASALLPVDSDHRGRLQLSIARAESMSPDRACAILRYAMDDVIRSGLRAGKSALPDPSQRADVVLSRPKGHPSSNGPPGAQGVVQSSEEALASLVEEMREVLTAPVYNNTPLQNVANRFLTALNDAQKSQQKNEERLEQNLGKLKGDFLLARAEWEEKLTSTQENLDLYKTKYNKLKSTLKQEGYMDQTSSRPMSERGNESTIEDDDDASGFMGIRSSNSRGGTGSVASLGSGLAQHARSIVGTFQCVGNNPRTGPVVAAELAEGRDAEIREMAFRHADDGYGVRENRSRRNNRYNNGPSDRSYASGIMGSRSDASSRSKQSRSFREYSRSPQRVDV